MRGTNFQLKRDQYRKAKRESLRSGQFIRRLLEIAEKLETVEPSAVPALKAKADIYHKLLAKCLPDLKATEITGEITHKRAEELSDEELLAIAAAGREDPAGEADGERTTH